MATRRRGAPSGRARPCHAAVQGRWESLRLDPLALLRGGASFVSILAAFFLVFSLWDQRYVLGQPDESGVVVSFHAVGTIHWGKSSCDGVEVRLQVDRPRPDLSEPTATFRACQGDYRSGETVWVRRVPGHPNRTYADPFDGAGLAFLGLLAGGTAAIAVAAGVWEERRSRKSQEQLAAGRWPRP